MTVAGDLHSDRLSPSDELHLQGCIISRDFRWGHSPSLIELLRAFLETDPGRVTEYATVRGTFELS